MEPYSLQTSREQLAPLVQQLTRAMLSEIKNMPWEDAIFAAGIAVNAVSSMILSIKPPEGGMSENDMRREVTRIFGTAMLNKVMTKQIDGDKDYVIPVPPAGDQH